MTSSRPYPFSEISSGRIGRDLTAVLFSLVMYHCMFQYLSSFNDTYSVIWLPNAFALFFVLFWKHERAYAWILFFLTVVGVNYVVYGDEINSPAVLGYIINNSVFIGGMWFAYPLISNDNHVSHNEKKHDKVLASFWRSVCMAAVIDIIAALTPLLIGLLTEAQFEEMLTGNFMSWVVVLAAMHTLIGGGKSFSYYCILTTIVFNAALFLLIGMSDWFGLMYIYELVQWSLVIALLLPLFHSTPRSTLFCNMVCIIAFSVILYTQKLSLSIQFFLSILLVIINAINILLQLKLKMELSLKSQMQQLQHESITDQLTGLLNRRGFLKECDVATLSGRPLAIGFIDVNKFKMINDSLGHAVGDELLIILGSKLINALGPTACIGRMGGDEFAFFIPQTELSNIIPNLSGLNQLQVHIATHIVPLSLSIGCSRYPHDADDIELLLHKADTAMFTAKQRGCRTPLNYATDFDAVDSATYSLSDLRGLLEQCYSVYQPVVDIQLGSIRYVEALVRHPDVNTAAILKACSYHQEWDYLFKIMLNQALSVIETLNIPVALNVTPSQFINGDELLNTLRNVSQQCWLSSIILEVTENEPITDPSKFRSTVDTVRGMGCKLSLDDFGAGFAFFESLNIGYFDSIKIDRAMISDIYKVQKKQALLCAIKQYCNSLDISIIAEGVENHEELKYLSSVGIRMIQGYVFSHPMKRDNLEQFINVFEKTSNDDFIYGVID